MNITEVGIEGLMVIEPRVFHDARGYFFESYNKEAFEAKGLAYDFVQDNQSFSCRGTVRGLHMQKGEHAQAKLVRAIRGHIRDVVVDLRPGSSTFGHQYVIDLTDENRLMLMIPRGFAHGFSVLSESAEFGYKCDNFYCREAEVGIRFDDRDLAIDWGIGPGGVIASGKDRELPAYKEFLESWC